MQSFKETVSRIRPFCLAVTGVAATLVLGACASNPTGGANFVLMSENAELELDQEYDTDQERQD